MDENCLEADGCGFFHARPLMLSCRCRCRCRCRSYVITPRSFAIDKHLLCFKQTYIRYSTTVPHYHTLDASDLHDGFKNQKVHAMVILANKDARVCRGVVQVGTRSGGTTATGGSRMLVASCRRGYPADIAASHGIIIVSILRAKLLAVRLVALLKTRR